MTRLRIISRPLSGHYTRRSRSLLATMLSLLDLPTELRLIVWAHLYDILVDEHKRIGNGIGQLDIQWDVYDMVHDSSIKQALHTSNAESLKHPINICDIVNNEALPYFVGAMQRLSSRPHAVVNLSARDGPGSSALGPEVLCRPFRALRLGSSWQLRINIYLPNEDALDTLIQRIDRLSSVVQFDCAPRVVELCIQPAKQALSHTASERLLQALCGLKAASFHVHVGPMADTQLSDEMLVAILLKPTGA